MRLRREELKTSGIVGDGSKLEEFLSEVNSAVALREFAFSRNKFWPTPADSKEFADGVLWLDNRLVVYQTKERNIGSDHSVPALKSWFKEAVEKVASRQIRDTHHYLKKYDAITLTNARGHRFNVNTKSFEHIINVILIGSRVGFPGGFSPKKYHLSKTTGLFIHVLGADEYLNLCRVLITPMEVTEYLLFRQQYLIKVPQARQQSEKWLLGRFLMSPEIHEPSLDESDRDLSVAVDNLHSDETEFRAWTLLEGMGDQLDEHHSVGVRPIHHVSDETHYYDVLMAFVRLRRAGFKAFGERLTRAIENANKDKTYRTRLETPRESIGYIVLGLPRARYSQRRDYLVRLMTLSKYERKLDACAGVSVCLTEGNRVDIDWAWIKDPWAYDATIEKMLEAGSPFPPMKERKVLLYPTEV